MIHYFFMHPGNTKGDTTEQFCTENTELSQFLQLVAQEADDVVGLDDAHHATLAIDHGQ